MILKTIIVVLGVSTFIFQITHPHLLRENPLIMGISMLIIGILLAFWPKHLYYKLFKNGPPGMRSEEVDFVLGRIVGFIFLLWSIIFLYQYF
jgi:membrane protease YdiL (CAAX protease family)